jgi:hypothetical protein
MPEGVETIEVPVAELTDTHVMVGECGGLCAVRHNRGLCSWIFAGGFSMEFVVVETEHGSLFLDPENIVEVLA